MVISQTIRNFDAICKNGYMAPSRVTYTYINKVMN